MMGLYTRSYYKIYQLFILTSFVAISAPLITYGQINSNCNNNGTNQTYTATAFFNYGAASGLYNSETTAAITVGQTVVNLNMFSPSYRNELGFWGQFLLPPSAPFVQASEGNLGDRVEVTWTISKLSPVVTDVFKIYRNGTFLDEVAKDERVYVDYNVVAGEFYTYTVRGVNKAGVGMPGSSVGFLNPNGTITGQIKTISGNPVKDCAIDLTPTLGTSLRFTGDGMAFAEYSPLFDTSRFTLAFWVKQDSLNDSAGLIDLGSSIDKNWWVHTLPAASGRGVVVKLAGNTDSLHYVFPGATQTDWQHIAVTYSGTNLILYVNGEIMGSMAATLTRDSIPLYFGSKTENTGYFKGNLDEILIYNKQLTQTEIQRNIYKSISGKTPGLIAYWKMDEGKGSKTYDLTQNENRMYMCGPAWSSKKAPVTNSSLSDENGYYIMEGINYGTGQTFTVKPSKKIYFDVSLEFNASDEKWAELTNFDLPDSSAVSISFNVFDLNGTQTILAKENHLNLKMVDGELILDLEGNEVVLDTLTIGWNHVFLRLYQQMADLQLTYYRNGQLKKSDVVSITSSDWSMDGIHWTLGSSSPDTPADYFTGLIDDVVFYRDSMELPDIQVINNAGTNPGDARIFAYFSLNESQGDSLYNTAEISGVGVVRGATWANVSRVENTLDHEFLPSSKLVTLNKTNTSTDQVDFVDLSTIPVSGYVRYDKTSCFVDSVEILINGFSASPPIFTNADGYFVADLEPGSSVKLSPKYHGHIFSPAFFEVKNIASPVAGILFLDKTTRTVSGQLAGGNCRKSIIPGGGSAKVRLTSSDPNTCYEKEIEITAADGKYTFENVPPFKCAIGVSDHSINPIKTYFSLQGGQEIDLTFVNDTIDFIYYSPPVVTMSSFGEEICGETVVHQNTKYKTTISLHQIYTGGNCPVDTATIITFDGLNQDVIQVDTFQMGKTFDFEFVPGPPNLASPYRKTLQVTAIANGISSDESKQAVILGRRPRNVNFTSTSPSIPFMILHDPPGDGSYSTLERGRKVCNNYSMGITNSFGTDKSTLLSLGPDIVISAGSSFVNVETTLDITADIEISSSMTYKTTSTQSSELCTEYQRSVSTDQDEILVGDTSDLFIGGAFNLLFGITDILDLDTANMNCFKIDTGINVLPGGFNTTFFYTEYQIRKNIVPNLLTIGDTISANRWLNIIELNNENKQNAPLLENLSFGSGVNIERSVTNSKTTQNTYSFEVDVSDEIGLALGVLSNGVGGQYSISTSISMGQSSSHSNTLDHTVSTGFHLSDNDPGDILTVDLKRDPVYGTPVFKTISGSSSCPYEKKTVPRDEVSLTVNRFVANNVRENDEAVFQFNLGNISQTAETRNYVFSLRSSSNVNGAIVKINGADPEDTEFQIPPFQSIPVTVSVERGPTSYTDTLTFDFVAQCEDERNILLGNPKENTPFTKSITVIVNFIEPCSSVDISNPQQDWVQTPADGPLRPITLFDYDINDDDLDLIRVQYRRSQGNGLWINIVEIPKDSLGVLFENLDWNTDGLEDGLYEIRALAVCTGGIDVGISHVIKGRIERTPPDLFGTAEPADGVLSRGDEISITFNEPVQCNEIILAAGIGANIQNNNLGMYNTETGELIDFTMSCSGDKIILVPNIANKFIENKVLRVELDSILDLAGNKSGHFEWEFVVDRNSVNWIDRQDVKVTKYEEDFIHVERRIENRGGFIVSWELQNVPDYCDIYPTAGDLAPGEVRIINFDFDRTMVFGKQLDTMLLHGPEGDEPMIIDSRVICHQPEWDVNEPDFEYAMNLVLELNIEGVVSQDEEDLVAAFINDQLRGVASVEYYPAIDKYLAFLNVYSNSISPDSINIKIWDASTCLLYNSVVESFNFESDDLIGTPLDPQVVHTNSMVLKEIPVHPGWNWLSFNLLLQHPEPDSLLSDINNPLNAIIKSQTQFAQYDPVLGWFGSLDSVDNISAYQLRANDHDTILMVGSPIHPDSLSIPLEIGWNWIGYIPSTPMTTDLALSSLTVLDGDLIKSQTQFAQYVSGLGWIGTLSNMKPGEGYIIKTSLVDTIAYPNLSEGFTSTDEYLAAKQPKPHDWEVKPSQFEHTMTITGTVLEGNGMSVNENWFVGAFYGEECRGFSKALWVEPLQKYYFFITTYSNTPGEILTFKAYTGESTLDLQESLYFDVNTQHGRIDNPFPFTLLSSAVPESEYVNPYLITDPNPVVSGEKVRVSYFTGASGDVLFQLFDNQGQVVWSENVASDGTKQTYWLQTRNIPPGLYNLSLSGQKMHVHKKLIIIQ